MNCYIFYALVFVVLVTFLLIYFTKLRMHDRNVCSTMPNSYYSWCIKSYNRSYYEYTSGGIGNRIKSVNEVITMALVYDYLPKILWWNMFETYFSTPFPNFVDTTYHFCIRIDLCKMDSSSIEKILLENKYFFCFTNLWCDISFHIASNKKNIQKLYNQRLISNINENNARKLYLQIQYNVLNKIIQLKSKYMKIYNDYSNDFKNYENVVGIHIRTGNGDFKDSRNFLTEGEKKSFEEEAIHYSVNRTNTKWIILGDDSKILNSIRNKNIQFHTDVKLSTKKQHYLKDMNDDTSLRELLLLIHSTYFIITNQSTFGLLSMLWSGRCLKFDNYSSCMKSIGSCVKVHKYPLFDGNIDNLLDNTLHS